jgi:hypothetical protein
VGQGGTEGDRKGKMETMDGKLEIVETAESREIEIEINR